MNVLLKTKLIGLLSDAAQVTNEETLRAVYGDFMEQIKAVSQSENDYSDIFRMLNLTRIEFDSIGSSPLYGQGKKCLEIRLS